MLATKNYNKFESPSWNDGWESYFIDREINDNPHTINTESHSEWVSGFRAAKTKATEE